MRSAKIPLSAITSGSPYRTGLKPLQPLMRNTLKALWSGDFPLGQAFWYYAIAYGTIVNIFAQAAAIAAVLAGLPAEIREAYRDVWRPAYAATPLYPSPGESPDAAA